MHMHMPPPRPEHTYTQFGIAIHTTQYHTQHNMSRVGRGVGGQTQTPHKHPLSVKLSLPPPFHVAVWVSGATVLVVLKAEKGIHLRFASVFLFLKWPK